MEFWHDIAIDRSWKLLQELRRRVNFILIGGWAVYLLTKSVKSKDIDVSYSMTKVGSLQVNHNGSS